MTSHVLSARAWLLALAAIPLASAALTVSVVPPDLQMPGTQPFEIANLPGVSNCDNCHGGYDAVVEPAHNWRGSMMAHAARDPLFWASVAVAEQDFPGVGDLCIRCHSPRGWLEGRSTPTDGSALTSADVDGTECAICHSLVNPDDSEHVGVQVPPFVAHDGGTPPEAYRGSGMYVMWPGNERLGPYDDAVARHAWLESEFHRSSDFCATCHDVSNPLVGDVAHDNGAMVPLAPGTFVGTLGGPLASKAAFNNPPYAYGVVERTYSEHVASALSTLEVADYETLPRELRDGALRQAYLDALATGQNGHYADRTPRVFSCQSCHVPPRTGKGADKNNAPIRPDLPLHDLTGGNYWVPDAILWLDARNRLVLGGGLRQAQIDALLAGKDRALESLRRSAALWRTGNTLRIVNLTGHKLTTGFPEGRRMWVHTVWRDAHGTVVREDGAYGPIPVTIGGQPAQVETIQDLADPHLHVLEAKPGITQEWAAELVGAGLSPTLELEYDRVTEAVTLTLGDLANSPPGTVRPTFHFALNNRFVKDTRIPPFGMRYDDARVRSALPVPADQFGDPGPGGVYDHAADVALVPPPTAVEATIELLYQPTSWEYVQFLHLANDGSVAHLATTGADLLDAWRNTGMAAPVVVASTLWCRTIGTEEDLVLLTEVDDGGALTLCRKSAPPGSSLEVRFESPDGTYDGSIAAIVFQFYPTGTVLPSLLPTLHFTNAELQLGFVGLPAEGVEVEFSIPIGFGGLTLRMQGVALSLAAPNGLYASTDAHDVVMQ